MKNHVILIVVSFFVSLVSLEPVFAENWAEEMFTERRHDFGTVAIGAEAIYRFQFKNIWKEDVHVADIRSSCGCTIVSVTKNWLKTDEISEVVAKLNTSGQFEKDKSATITVVFDKPYVQEAQLQVTSYIRPDVVLNPGVIEFGSVGEGKSVTKQLQLQYAGRPDWKLVGIETSSPNINVEAKLNENGRGRIAYNIFVTLNEGTPSGYVQDMIRFVTNDPNPEASSIMLPVHGYVTAPLVARPSSVMIGNLEPGKSVTKNIVIRGDSPFRVTKVSSSDTRFRFSTSSQENRIQVIPVTFTANDNLGEVDAILTVQTNMSNQPPVKIIVQGDVFDPMEVDYDSGQIIPGQQMLPKNRDMEITTNQHEENPPPSLSSSLSSQSSRFSQSSQSSPSSTSSSPTLRTIQTPFEEDNHESNRSLNLETTPKQDEQLQIVNTPHLPERDLEKTSPVVRKEKNSSGKTLPLPPDSRTTSNDPKMISTTPTDSKSPPSPQTTPGETMEKFVTDLPSEPVTSHFESNSEPNFEPNDVPSMTTSTEISQKPATLKQPLGDTVPEFRPEENIPPPVKAPLPIVETTQPVEATQPVDTTQPTAEFLELFSESKKDSLNQKLEIQKPDPLKLQDTQLQDTPKTVVADNIFQEIASTEETVKTVTPSHSPLKFTTPVITQKTERKEEPATEKEPQIFVEISSLSKEKESRSNTFLPPVPGMLHSQSVSPPLDPVGSYPIASELSLPTLDLIEKKSSITATKQAEIAAVQKKSTSSIPLLSFNNGNNELESPRIDFLDVNDFQTTGQNSEWGKKQESGMFDEKFPVRLDSEFDDLLPGFATTVPTNTKIKDYDMMIDPDKPAPILSGKNSSTQMTKKLELLDIPEFPLSTVARHNTTASGSSTPQSRPPVNGVPPQKNTNTGNTGGLIMPGAIPVQTPPSSQGRSGTSIVPPPPPRIK